MRFTSFRWYFAICMLVVHMEIQMQFCTASFVPSLLKLISKSSSPVSTLRLFSSTQSNVDRGSLQEVERAIVRLGRSGKTDDALDLYRRSMRECRHDSAVPGRNKLKLMNLAIDACARARPTRLSTAFEIFFDEVNSGDDVEKRTTMLRPNVFTFGALMSACARARDAEKAIKLLDVMESKYGVKPNAVVFGAAISACERSYSNAMYSTSLELLERACSDPSVSLSPILFNTAMSACARAEKWELAVGLIRDMEMKYNIQPDEISYATVMAACERSNQWKMVLQYADICEQSFRLDGVALSSALHACQQLALADKAISYLERMKYLQKEDVDQRTTNGRKRSGARKPLRGPDEVAYFLTISACSRAGEWRKGLDVLEEMKATGLSRSVKAYSAAIGGCAEAGEWKVALRLLTEMSDQGVKPNVVTYSTAISACAKALSMSDDKEDPFRAAMILFKRMKQDTRTAPNIVSYNAAITACAEGLKIDQAFALFNELTQTKLEPTIVTYGGLMTACERVGDSEKAERLFSIMKENGIVANEIVYGAAISCCRKAEKADKCYSLLKEMLKLDLRPNVATFNTVIRALTNSNDLTKALRILKYMESRDETVSPNQRTYSMIISALALNNMPEEAETLISAMSSKGMNVEVELYTATVRAYETTHKPRLALNLMEKMRRNGYNFYDNPVLDRIFKALVNTLSSP